MSLKDFQILCKLGEGAYSTVYKVSRESNKQVYALKKVKLANLSDKQIQNALNQVRILASIKNNSIVGYKQVFLDGKNLCIIMEFLDDGDLYQKIVQHKKNKQYFTQAQIWNVTIQILYGLQSLHSLNILHRDIKSANVFLSKQGYAKLGDLNVSKVAKNGLLYTQTGTPYYASPQVWKDQPYNTKSDIWSLGCVIYEMATLEPPFQAQDMEGLYQKVTIGLYNSISSSYSKQLSHLIKMLLQVNPRSRPSTQKILASALIKKKLTELVPSIKPSQSLKEQLLKTIRIPKNLHSLTDKLPKSNYTQLDTSNYTQHNSPQAIMKKNTAANKSLGKGSLPKLHKIRKIYQGSLLLNQQKQNYKISNLMIEGKSKIIQDTKSPNRNYSVERNMEKQLKKVYLLKGAKSSQHLQRRRSEKSMFLPPIKH